MSKKLEQDMHRARPVKMHVGNLRTALYEYLIAKHEGGDPSTY